MQTSHLKEVLIINCKRCNRTVKTTLKGWARKYCEKCRKEVDREYAKESTEKRKDIIIKRRKELELNPRPKFIGCFECGGKIKNTCWNKKYCSECKKKQHSKVSKNWVIKNPEKRKEIDARRDSEKRKIYHKKRRKEYTEYVRNLDRQRYLRDGEKRRALVRKYHKENKDAIRNTKRKYRASEYGKLKCQDHSRKRRVRKINVIHNFSLEEWKLKLKQTNGYCPSCKKFVGILKLTLDHTPPISKVSKGFVYTINEVNPLCKSCNSKKYNKMDKDTVMRLY
ncbi:HNH endonuclease [Candidatus Pacearchaeota archaeon]|nr:HNH endonuclease [Candidatus Pacearchaeota archaeon]